MTLLRDYQQGAHDAVLAAWGEKPWYTGGDTFRSVLAVLATSAGKTVIAGAIIKTVMERGRCLFVADTDELCSQPSNKFKSLFGITAAIDKAKDKARLNQQVVIGSAQTLTRKTDLEMRRLLRYPHDHFQYIFIDEAHRGVDRNQAILDHFPAAKVMGMTATAFRAKLKDLSKYYEHVAFEMGVFDLIDEGYIAPLKVLTLPVKVDISAVKQKRNTQGENDYDKSELDTTIRPYYEEICRLIKEHAPERHIISFLSLRKSSAEFVQVAREMGITAHHVQGDSPDRWLMTRSFAKGEFRMLSNSNLLSTGWDCPRCDCLLNLTPTRSAGMFRQKVGRIGRLLPGVIDGLTDKDERKAAIAASDKPDALILDLLWQTGQFGLMGPADLIANSEAQRAAIQEKLALSNRALNLQEVTAEVQAEYDQALIDAILAGSKKAKAAAQIVRDPSQMVDARLVAAVLHASKAVNYEPVMKWHGNPVSDAQRKLLESFRVDPASVKDMGHASAMLDVLLGRLRRKMAPYLVVEALAARQIADPAGYSDRQAMNVLGGHYPLPFSKKHYGQPLRSIPGHFWSWCKQQPWIKARWPLIWEWMTSVLDKQSDDVDDGRCQCIGSHQAPNCPIHPRHETDDDIPGLAVAASNEADPDLEGITF